MNNTPTASETATAAPAASTFNFLDVLIVLARRRRLLILFPFTVAVVAALLSMLLPNIYVASTKILPPQQPQSGASALLAQLGGVAAAAGAGGGPKNPSDLYIGMLRSRTIGDRLIQRFELDKVYGAPRREVTRALLAQNTAAASGKEGLIAIEVEDRDPKRAAALANAYTEELIKLTSGLALTGATQRRLFFERQLAQSKDNLANAEATLKGALNVGGVVSVEGESRAIVETVARLRAQIAAKAIELDAMRAFVTNNNPDYKRSEQALRSMREELNRMENGRPDGAAPAGARAAGGLENIKVLREVHYHQMLYELLAKQYEAARLEEAKESSIIQVLDPAVVPERHAKPKRAIVVVCAAIAALFLAIGWVLLTAALGRAAERPALAGKMAELRALLRLRRVMPR